MTGMRHAMLGTLVSVAVATGAAYLSAHPSVRVLPGDTAVITVSISHAGGRSCRDLSDEEMAKLPANMRRREVCERRRLPLLLEMDIDGATVLAEVLPPGGIAGDAASNLHRRIPVPAGPHEIALRLRDSDRAEGFDHTARRSVDLSPAQNLAIDFRADDGGFRLR